MVKIVVTACLVLACTFFSGTASAIEFYFEPDTLLGDSGQIVTIECRIAATELMRGFTVYMFYDTNIVDLNAPPIPGPVIAGHEGLNFNYSDHGIFLPDVLQVGATIFGTDFWQGPGTLFSMEFILRQCGVDSITAPYSPSLVAADGTYPPTEFTPALIVVCELAPNAVQALTIMPTNAASVLLRWPSVTQNVLGQPLIDPPVYVIYRQQVQPTVEPFVNIAQTSDTMFTDPFDVGTEYIYYVIAQTDNR